MIVFKGDRFRFLMVDILGLVEISIVLFCLI